MFATIQHPVLSGGHISTMDPELDSACPSLDNSSPFELLFPIAIETTTCCACPHQQFHPVISSLKMRQPSPCSPGTLWRARLPFLHVIHLIVNSSSRASPSVSPSEKRRNRYSRDEFAIDANFLRDATSPRPTKQTHQSIFLSDFDIVTDITAPTSNNQRRAPSSRI
ncbi:hypothetical protein EI94DRAFT_1140256 [Lactarius quietus]|nr:hypothetical protein EI94DRAFT_1140256 [Lactarius quietus]